jgi:hypothetical protein
VTTDEQIASLKDRVSELERKVSSLADQNEALRKGINFVGREVSKRPLPNPIGASESAESWFKNFMDGLKRKE